MPRRRTATLVLAPLHWSELSHLRHGSLHFTLDTESFWCEQKRARWLVWLSEYELHVTNRSWVNHQPADATLQLEINDLQRRPIDEDINCVSMELNYTIDRCRVPYTSSLRRQSRWDGSSVVTTGEVSLPFSPAGTLWTAWKKWYARHAPPQLLLDPYWKRC